MNAVPRQTDTHLLPTWSQRVRMAGYAMTIVVSLACSGMFYLALGQSYYRCYLYNASLTVHGWSGGDNRTHLLDELIWYRTDNCVYTFFNPLLIGSVVGIRVAMLQSRRLVSIRLVLICYDLWCLVRSVITTLRFTDCYLNLYEIISQLPAKDFFRNNFEKSVQPYYEISVILFWSLSWLCTMDFVLSFGRTTIDNADNWVDCKCNWVDVQPIWSYDYVTMEIKIRRPAVLHALESRRRRTATTRRLRTKYLLSQSIKKIF